MSSVRRIIVGASRSPGSLQAMRYARHLARDLDATLVAVLAWLPPCGDLADRRTPNEELRLCVPRIPSTVLTSRVALSASGS
jgi:nucleotide-binding universal stress UspA family protein